MSRAILYVFLLVSVLLIGGCKSKASDQDSIADNDLETIIMSADSVDDGGDDDDNFSLYEERSLSPAIVYSDDSIVYVYADMNKDFRMFGYARPDTTSQKMILYSIFTSDVEDNPFDCPFGAYYETNGLTNGKLRIVSKDDPQFIKVEVSGIDLPNDTVSNTVYFLKNLIQFKD